MSTKWSTGLYLLCGNKIEENILISLISDKKSIFIIHKPEFFFFNLMHFPGVVKIKSLWNGLKKQKENDWHVDYWISVEKVIIYNKNIFHNMSLEYWYILIFFELHIVPNKSCSLKDAFFSFLLELVRKECTCKPLWKSNEEINRPSTKNT